MTIIYKMIKWIVTHFVLKYVKCTWICTTLGFSEGTSGFNKIWQYLHVTQEGCISVFRDVDSGSFLFFDLDPVLWTYWVFRSLTLMLDPNPQCWCREMGPLGGMRSGGMAPWWGSWPYNRDPRRGHSKKSSSMRRVLEDTPSASAWILDLHPPEQWEVCSYCLIPICGPLMGWETMLPDISLFWNMGVTVVNIPSLTHPTCTRSRRNRWCKWAGDWPTVSLVVLCNGMCGLRPSVILLRPWSSPMSLRSGTSAPSAALTLGPFRTLGEEPGEIKAKPEEPFGYNNWSVIGHSHGARSRADREMKASCFPRGPALKWFYHEVVKNNYLKYSPWALGRHS